MNAEDLGFRIWQFELFQTKGINEALRQADSGRLVPHSAVEEFFKSRRTSNAPVVLRGMAEAAKIRWSDAVIGHLRSICEYTDHAQVALQRRLSSAVFSRPLS
jgi:hypothetical protein